MDYYIRYSSHYFHLMFFPPPQRLFEEQLKKYEQVKVYIDQNLAAQENILKALTDANVQYATVRKNLAETEHK